VLSDSYETVTYYHIPNTDIAAHYTGYMVAGN